jgi:hypothetical protein
MHIPCRTPERKRIVFWAMLEHVLTVRSPAASSSLLGMYLVNGLAPCSVQQDLAPCSAQQDPFACTLHELPCCLQTLNVSFYLAANIYVAAGDCEWFDDFIYVMGAQHWVLAAARPGPNSPVQ